jgi:hypothetical protein
MKMTGAIVGSVIALVFLAYLKFPFSTDFAKEGAFIDIAMFTGIFLGGAISGFIVENIYLLKFLLPSKFFSAYKAGSLAGCIIGGVISLPIAFIFGIMVGGLLGGGVASILWKPLVPIGICIGIIGIIILIVTIASFVGSTLGCFAEGFVRWILKGVGQRE